ncbi:CENP-B protein, partial [Ascobolus immersus RN42]
MLVFDGHGSHLTIDFLQYCWDNKIIPYRLPSHSTHIMQPLDVRVFQPYKHQHTLAIERSTRDGIPVFDKIEFLANLKQIRLETLKVSTILSAFRATGLVPHCPEVALSQI